MGLWHLIGRAIDLYLRILWKLPFTNWFYDIATEFMTEHRGWFVIFFVLPFSLLFDVYFTIRAKIVMMFYSAPALHEERVKDIQKQIKAWKDSGATNRLCTARGGWQSISPGYRTYKAVSHQISVNLYDILEYIEEDPRADGNATIRVEPMVNMGQISHFLVPKGKTLPVLPEMDDLTVGGLMMGVGIETSSHKYGLFNDAVIEAEVVLADGSVVKCSHTQNRDLFDALPWSYGTLGFLVSLTVRLVPCKQFIRIEYHPFTNQKASQKALEEYSEGKGRDGKGLPDFVEALAYSKNSMVVMPAWMVDAKDVKSSQLNRISRWYKPWFYKHVESYLLKKPTQVVTEYIPLRDYYHRHTKSIFWELEQIIPVGNHPLFRLLLGWAVPPKVSFLKLTQTKAVQKLYETQHVIQDMLVPLADMPEAIDVFEQHYKVYPLWICPYRAYDYSEHDGKKEVIPHRCFLRKPQANAEDEYFQRTTRKGALKWEMYVDIGAYGVPKDCLDKKPFDIVKVSRTVERYVASARGFQMLYADSYMNEDEFRSMFAHDHYDAMKKKFDPNGAFPQVYEKVCKKGAALWVNKESKKSQ